MYGFHKVNKTQRGQQRAPAAQTWEFTHHKFVRGRPWQLEEIKRRSPDAGTSSKDASRALIREIRCPELYNRGSGRSSSSMDEEHSTSAVSCYGHLGQSEAAQLPITEHMSHLAPPSTTMSGNIYAAGGTIQSAHPGASPRSGRGSSPGRTICYGPLQAQQAYYAFLQQSQIIPCLDTVGTGFAHEPGPTTQGEPYGATLTTSTPYGGSMSHEQDLSYQNLSYEASSGMDLLREAYHILQDEVDSSRKRQLDLLQLVMELHDEVCIYNRIQLNRSLQRRIMGVREELIAHRMQSTAFQSQTHQGFASVPLQAVSSTEMKECFELPDEEQRRRVASATVSKIMLNPQNSTTLAAPYPLPRTTYSPASFAEDHAGSSSFNGADIDHNSERIGKTYSMSRFRSNNDPLGGSVSVHGEEAEGGDEVFADRESGYYERLGLQQPDTASTFQSKDVEMT